ncbi:MAG: hypothetical protein F4X02_06255 [Chloroflexi bacterium]|nr:hypothetical protein [Chloroflexota bacterium]
MPDARGIKHIPLARARNLPRLSPPAGYVIVIEDIDLGDRFKIVVMQEVNRRALAGQMDLVFETKLFLALSAADAEALALELHDRFAPGGDIDDWFDLDPAEVGQLRNFGRRPRRESGQPSLRDLALSEAEGRSLVDKSRVVAAPPHASPRQTQAARPRPQRRLGTWLLLLAIVALGAAVLGNAPQLRRILSELANPLTEQSQPRVFASATARPSPTARVSPTPFARAGDVFYVMVRANARVCASRACRAAEILEVGARIAAQRHESGQAIDGNSAWIAFLRRGRTLYVHSSVLSRSRPAVAVTVRPSATASHTAMPSATSTKTAMPTDTLAPTNTIAPAAASSTNTRAPTSTDKPIATAEPSETAPPRHTATLRSTATAAPEATGTDEPTATADLEPTATATVEPTVAATDLPAVLYIETANNLNALVRACPSTDCEILGRLRPGAAINPDGEAEGEVVNGIARWVAFEYDGRLAYVHGELVAESL